MSQHGYMRHTATPPPHESSNSNFEIGQLRETVARSLIFTYLRQKVVKTAQCSFIPEFINFEAHFLEYCRFANGELFPQQFLCICGPESDKEK